MLLYSISLHPIHYPHSLVSASGALSHRRDKVTCAAFVALTGGRARILTTQPSSACPTWPSALLRTPLRTRLMVYLPPPHLASETRPSYGEAYAKILATHRRSPATSASSVIILVSPDVDALCAAQMLAELFKQDDVMYRIVPISSHTEFENMRDELATYADVRIITTPSGVSG